MQSEIQPIESTELPLTFVEYFAGIGLFRMGLEAAGWLVVYANDWSPERDLAGWLVVYANDWSPEREQMASLAKVTLCRTFFPWMPRIFPNRQ